MKAKLLFSTLFICCGFLGFTQTDSLEQQNESNLKSGSVYYKRHFISVHKSMDINTILHFDKATSLFVWFKKGLDKNEKPTKLEMGGFKKGMNIHFSPRDKKGDQVFRNFKKKLISERVVGIGGLDDYIIKDIWIPLKWTIQKKHKTILGYKCQKAITQFRGRIYAVWFTKEIPVPYGPWKLFGLPGLILEAHDTANIVNYVATNVCYPCKVKPENIQIPHEKDTKTLKESVYFSDHYQLMLVKKMNEVAKKMGNGIQVIPGNPKTKEGIKNFRETHSPERIYAWEKFPGDTPNPYKNDSVPLKQIDTIPQESGLKK